MTLFTRTRNPEPPLDDTAARTELAILTARSAATAALTRYRTSGEAGDLEDGLYTVLRRLRRAVAS